MSRWFCLSICAILGLVMLVCGLLMPAHLRAVEIGVIQRAGRSTRALIGEGLARTREQNLGAAQLIFEAAQQENVPGREVLGQAVSKLAAEHPDWVAWGGGDPHLERLFQSDPQAGKSVEPFTHFIIRTQNRDVVLELLRSMPRPALQQLLGCRSLTNTVIFPPSASASGQAFDASISICGLLLEGGHLATGLRDRILALASQTRQGASSLPLEQVLLDIMSLGQRLNWSQLVVFMNEIQDADTLRQMASAVRNAGGHLPVLFAAVDLSGKPAKVSQYLLDWTQSGLGDLGLGLRSGAGGIDELLRRNQRLHDSALGQRLSRLSPLGALRNVALDCAWQTPELALGLKWLFYFVGGFLLAAAAHFAWPAATALEQPLQVRGFHVGREVLFALGFLVVVLLLSEPFLVQENQNGQLPFRVRLPTAGSVAAAANLNNTSPKLIMNEPILLTLLLFFVLQALLYTACLLKLAEIRRQRVPARTKLKLLENEDHLFDAGLYLGFVGTIISFILFSVGVMKLSLMAAYSSTSFGIIFVSFFKIFHLRPARRKLLLEVEAVTPVARVHAAPEAALATAS